MRTGVEVANTRIDWWIYLSVGEIGKYTGAIKLNSDHALALDVEFSTIISVTFISCAFKCSPTLNKKKPHKIHGYYWHVNYMQVKQSVSQFVVNFD